MDKVRLTEMLEGNSSSLRQTQRKADGGHKFTFEVNDMTKRSFRFFEDKWKKKELCDITFRIGNDSVYAHRIIITAAIPYFRDILSNNVPQGEGEDINLLNIEPEAFKSLIEYSYTFKLETDSHNVMNILSAACYLRMDEVKEACCDFLAENLDFENLLNIRELARDLNCLELLSSIDCHVRENFYGIVETEKFLNWPVAFLKEIIEGKNLHVDREQTVLEAAIKWVKVCPEDRKDEFPDLLRRIRLHQVDPLYLVDTVQNEGFIETSPPIRNLIDEAIYYNLFPQKRRPICSFPTESRQSAETAQQSDEENNLRIYKLEVEETWTVQSFSIAGDEWKIQSKSSFYTTTGSTVATQNQMYFLYCGDALQYDVLNDAWEYLNGIPIPSTRMGAVVLKEKIYVLGGKINSQTASSAARCYDPETNDWTKVEPMRTARWGLSAVALSGYIFVLGGRNDASVFNSVERYDPGMDEWETMRSMLTERYYAGAASVKEKIYVCGGLTLPDETECVATVEVYDPMRNTWTFIRPMNSPRWGFTLLPFHSKLYAIGGADDKGNSIDQFSIYNPESDEWTTGPSTDPDYVVSGAVTMPAV